jgi:hypothetical protein
MLSRPTPTDSPYAAPRLARAFLALGDGPEPLAPAPRSPAVLLAASVAAAVLALSAPVAWATASMRHDQPLATQAAKAAVPSPDDDGADGGA